jgi:CMP-N-acetylneuraminic acid synthetase/spore coat polysaccharide biosynthesis predicted glycosyltransferase SpsG
MDEDHTPTPPSVLAVIPARGNSKGIPRKNLRSLAGRPLISYAIQTVLASRFKPYLLVSTDDEEIALIAQRYGANVHLRSPELARDETTLDPVVNDALIATESRLGATFDLVATVQPTSPLLRTASLDAALARFADDEDLDTIISATDDTHLTWRREGGRYVPNYVARVNRQQLPPTFRETGGFLITRRRNVTAAGRIGPNVQLHVLEPPESIDIDSHDDWGLCSYYLRRRRVLFVVTGSPRLGLGHVYNSLLLANDLMDHEIRFLVDEGSELARDVIGSKNFPVEIQTGPSLADDVARIAPHVVVNDRLDTTAEYMESLRALGVRTMNIEDLGPGAALADAVVNALYQDPDLLNRERAYFGHRYACLRDEFFTLPDKGFRDAVERVLVTFGGTDPSHNTERVLDAVEPWCQERGIALDVVTGPGIGAGRLEDRPYAKVHRNVSNISDYMWQADVAFTSAGRTLFELAAVRTPAIVLAQNERELQHTFASEAFGFVNLGLGRYVSGATIRETLDSLVNDTGRRRALFERMSAIDMSQGRANVLRIIEEVVRSA